MSSRIGVVDYGMGNLRSVLNAFEEIDQQAALLSKPSEVAGFDRIVIPGVGAFCEAMDNLQSTGMDDALNRHVAAGKPLLGICLGMQLICRESTEDGHHSGLGLIDASVKHFPRAEGLKVPHMGWNAIDLNYETPMTRGLSSGADAYFVHSYYVDCDNKSDELGSTEHGIRFASMLVRDNVYGMQFHPEKSQHVGMQLLHNFATIQ